MHVDNQCATETVKINAVQHLMRVSEGLLVFHKCIVVDSWSQLQSRQQRGVVAAGGGIWVHPSFTCILFVSQKAPGCAARSIPRCAALCLSHRKLWYTFSEDILSQCEVGHNSLFS